METLAKLREAWQNEDLAACADLAARLSAERRGEFATRALDACLASHPAPKQLSEIVRIGADRNRWIQAHFAFNAVRNLTLAYEERTPEIHDPKYVLLLVAENAARVLYNGTSPTDPFDDDSAAWLLLTLAQMVRCMGSEELWERIWQLYIEALRHTSADDAPDP